MPVDGRFAAVDAGLALDGIETGYAIDGEVTVDPLYAAFIGDGGFAIGAVVELFGVKAIDTAGLNHPALVVVGVGEGLYANLVQYGGQGMG